MSCLCPYPHFIDECKRKSFYVKTPQYCYLSWMIITVLFVVVLIAMHGCRHKEFYQSMPIKDWGQAWWRKALKFEESWTIRSCMGSLQVSFLRGMADKFGFEFIVGSEYEGKYLNYDNLPDEAKRIHKKIMFWDIHFSYWAMGQGIEKTDIHVHIFNKMVAIANLDP